MTCIEPYIQEHMSYLARKKGHREQRWLEAEHKKMFLQWLADKVIGMSPLNVDAYVIQIGYRPRRVLQYQGYDINGYTFYTKKQDDKTTTIDSSRMEIAKDSYYGVIEEIWELDYTTVVIPILKCKWVDNTRSGVKVDNDGFRCVNLSTNGYLSDPFILAKQVDQDPPAQRIRRGINRIQDLPVGESVEFNKFGQAVGKWQFLFGKYVGTRTRRLISILKKNWKDVTKEEKKFLWSDIKAHFRLENDDVKKQTLLSCGTKWKAFKTRLRVKFMLKNVSPLTKWTHIEPNVWDQFCQNENTADKNKLRAQARARGQKQITRPRVGPKGYRGFEKQCNYCLARAPRDKVGIKPLPAELIDVSNKLVQAASELSQSSKKSKSIVDPLIMVLRPKHGGRTRGVGCDIGYKKGLEGYVRKKRTSEQRKDNEEIRNEVRQQMKEKLKSSDFWLQMRAKLKVELRNEILAEHNLSPREDDVPSSVELKSSLNLTTNMVRNESQGQQNKSFSPRQDHMRLNLTSTKSIVREEQQGEHNSQVQPSQLMSRPRSSRYNA
nr:hypothetical protein [Tanacetum cinerariifolium]